MNQKGGHEPMDQIKIGKFIAKKEKQKNIFNGNWQISLVSAIKQSQNGKGVLVAQKYHCYFHFAMN